MDKELYSEFKTDCPETIGEKDRLFDSLNYVAWLERTLINSREQVKKLNIDDVSKPFYCQQGLGIGGKDCDTQCEYCKED